MLLSSKAGNFAAAATAGDGRRRGRAGRRAGATSRPQRRLGLAGVLAAAGKPADALAGYRQAATLRRGRRQGRRPHRPHPRRPVEDGRGQRRSSPQENYAEAAAVYEKAAPQAGAANDHLLAMENWRMAAACHEQTGQTEKAWACGEQALKSAALIDPEMRPNTTLPFAGRGLLRLAGKPEFAEAQGPHRQDHERPGRAGLGEPPPMIAATHFDPVVGVDIHIIQPPGPVPPVPVPHPFIGMVIDPMEYAPIIGGTVKVNGMMRGVAGTGGKCLPPHIPIGGVFVKPPSNECEIFMGSQTVAFDGDPASRLGLPALSCHCIGMPLAAAQEAAHQAEVARTAHVGRAGGPEGPAGPDRRPADHLAHGHGHEVRHGGARPALKKLRKMQKASKKWQGLSDKMRQCRQQAARQGAGRPAS